MPLNTISVIGLGYIGLPTAIILASKNKKVIGVDINQKIVDSINSGNISINETNLNSLLKKTISNGFLKASTKASPADAFIITVPTPFNSESNKNVIPTPDVSYIKSASLTISKVLKEGDIVILESTSPVGTTAIMSSWLASFRPDLKFPHDYGEKSDIRIAYCPERVIPGKIVEELVNNNRVIGGITKKCSQKALEVYKLFVKGNCVLTNDNLAEMTKLTENAFRDVNIAFANEISIVCDKLHINVWNLIKFANQHPRVNILQPGPGVGGHCIAVDPWFIISQNPVETTLLTAARKVNDSKPHHVIDKLKISVSEYLISNPDKKIQDIKIACFGLTFKADSDDLRGSPALKITEELSNMNFTTIVAVEPNIVRLPHNLENVNLVSIRQALDKADIFLLLVDHKEFKDLKIKNKCIIDTRGIWS